MLLLEKKAEMEIYAGIDMGGTNLKFGLVTDEGDVLFSGASPTPPNLKLLLETIKQIWKILKEEATSRIICLGFGLPGIFNRRAKMIHRSPNYPGLNGVPLEPLFAQLVEVPFTIHNDANMAAYCEFLAGAGKGLKSMILLTIGTGVGSGIILGGQLWEGTNGFAGELGHITVNPEGDSCKCGSQGCLETEVSSEKIVKNYQQLTGQQEPLTSEEVYHRARQGDKAAQTAFTRAGYYLGLGLASAINLLDPEKIILGGGVMKAGDLLLQPALREIKKRSYLFHYSQCRIEPALLGNQAGFIGAALWAGSKFS